MPSTEQDLEYTKKELSKRTKLNNPIRKWAKDIHRHFIKKNMEERSGKKNASLGDKKERICRWQVSA